MFAPFYPWLTHSRFSEQSVYTCYGLNLQWAQSPNMWEVVDNVCQRLAQRAWLLPQLFISNCVKSSAGRSSAQTHIFTIPKDIRINGQTKHLWPICCETTGSKGMQTRQWESLFITVFTIVCSLSMSLYSTWRKCSFSCGQRNCCCLISKRNAIEMCWRPLKANCLTCTMTNQIQLCINSTCIMRVSKTKGLWIVYGS